MSPAYIDKVAADQDPEGIEVPGQLDICGFQHSWNQAYAIRIWYLAFTDDFSVYSNSVLAMSVRRVYYPLSF